MSYYNYEYDYEPSEFEEECEHLKDLIKQSALREVKEKITKLETENARMKDIVENYDNKIKELNKLKSQYEWNKKILEEEIKMRVRNERLNELFGDIQTVLYTVRNVEKPQPKCNKCDKDRKIHFKSPSGREYTEYCTCAMSLPYYEVLKTSIHEIAYDTKDNQVRKWYAKYDEWEHNEYLETILVEQDMIDNENFEDIKKCSKAYFTSKEKAQEYADWLNGKGDNKNNAN